MIRHTLAQLARPLALALLAASCGPAASPDSDTAPVTRAEPRPEIYADFTLAADLGHLSDDQREMIRVLIEASEIMDHLFWRQAYGDDYQQWLDSIGIDEARRFAELNYGPWDRLADEAPFVDGVGVKPLGANFYPADITREEFDAAYLPGKNGLYSLIRRDADGKLTVVPYHVAYADELARAAELLRRAADLAEDQAFATYLKLRAAALISDDFQMSDMYWMDVKSQRDRRRDRPDRDLRGPAVRPFAQLMNRTSSSRTWSGAIG